MHNGVVHWKPNPLLYPPHLRTRIKRRRGVGSDSLYVPWLKVRDVPSKGTSAIIRGVFTGRPHHLLSELEAIYFFLVERRASTVDLREQWPILDFDRTLELCEQFGVRHTARSGYPEPFTIDLLITERVDGKLKYRAASVKSPEDALDPLVRLRLKVEHAWCQERGIPWTLVDTKRFNKTMLETLRFTRAWFRHRYVLDPSLENRFVDQFAAAYSPNLSLGELLAKLSRQLRQPTTVMQDVFRYCAWSNRIKPSLEHPLALNAPVVLLAETVHA